jgi:hypothetical protein
MPKKLIPPATLGKRDVRCLALDRYMGLSYDTKNVNGSGRSLFKILSQQLPAGTEESHKTCQEPRGQESNLGPPKSEKDYSALNIYIV